MRPLVLTFKGVRSYIGEQTIDLRDRTLVGIIGETGSGKSSILEALHFALFGDCTWDTSSHKVLIADGGDGTLSVSLTFSAGNRTWLVERSISRNRSTSTHRLTSQDDGTITTGRRAVDARIRDIVGMDEETFTKSVILPQGRFEQLLHMSPTDRAGVLKGLLGIDELDSIRAKARDRHAVLLPQLTALATRRDELEPDPRQATAAARTHLGDVEETLGQLRDAATTVTAADRDRTDVAAEHRQITAAAAQLTHQLASHEPGTVTDLAVVAGMLDDEDHAIGARLGPITAELDQVARTLGDRAPGGPEADTANSAVTALTLVAEQLRQVAQLRSEIDIDTLDLATREASIEKLTLIADESDRAAEHSRRASQKLAAEADKANDRTEQIRLRLAAVRTTMPEVSAIQARIEQLDHRGQMAAEALAGHQIVLEGLDRSLAEAIEEQVTLQRLNSVAHAAEGLRPGDTCPVCTHALGPDFDPPQTATLTAINKTIKDLQKRQTRTVQDVAEAKAQAGQVATERPAADLEFAKASEASARALAALTDAIGAIDLDDQDAMILANTTAELADAKAIATAAEREYARLNGVAGADRATANAAAAELATRQQQLTTRQQTVAAKLTAMHTSCTGLPQQYQPTELTDQTIDAAVDAARRDSDEQDHLIKRTSELHEAIAGINIERRQLAERRSRLVNQPGAQHRQRTQAVVHLHDALADLLGNPHADPGDPTCNLAEQAVWTAASHDRAVKLANSAAQRLTELRARIKAAEAAISTALAAAPTGERSLPEAIEHQLGQHALAKDRHRRLAAQIPQADELQRRIDGVRPHINSLKALVDLLSDAKFIGYVVAERLHALLTNANALLAGMTRHRFAFGNKFEIFDEHTGQSRDVKTMSGGETFQASLALALALVEQTALNGGRAESLFLDEGFGTLDRAALTHALDALQHQVQAGRLVVVISHLRAVADHVPELLLVERGPGGSAARWANAQERTDIAEEDLYGGLQD